MDVARDFVTTANQLALSHVQHDRRLPGNENREILEVVLCSKTGFCGEALCQRRPGTGLSNGKVSALRLLLGDASGKET